jgi:hypothetical protein
LEGNAIGKMPDSLNCGDWCRQGFPYFSGNMTYINSFTATLENMPHFLTFHQWHGTALGVSINGSPEQILWHPPWQINISPFVISGKNTVEITVFGHRRNSLGPFYIHETWPDWTGPEQFRAYEQQERNLVSCGLIEPPILEY